MRHHEQYLQWPVSEAAATSLNGVQLMGGNLLIGRGSNAGTTIQGTITVQGWTATESLGIILDNAPVVNPVTGALFFNGDQRAKLIGSETQLGVTPDQPTFGTYAWSETAWVNDGTLANGISEVNFEDVIDASAAGANGSVMHGYGGNDALSGFMGRDDIFGDEGNDQIDGDMIGGKTRVRTVMRKRRACVKKNSYLSNRYDGYGLISHIRNPGSSGCASRLAASLKSAAGTAGQP